MSEREDVEALAEVLADHSASYEPISEGHPYSGYAAAILASSWLAVHDELVRADERKRLAGEIEEFARMFPTPQTKDALNATAKRLRARPPVRLTEEE